MTTPANDFVTVDMRGMKTALVARARAQRCSVSWLVRRAVGSALGAQAEDSSGAESVAIDESSPDPRSAVKLSIRLHAEEVLLLDRRARAAGLSRGAFLAGLVAQVPALSSWGSRPELLSAMSASNAVLATLSRDLRRLTMFLRRVDVESAQRYRALMDTLDGDVRRHLEVAAQLLADLRPAHRLTATAAARPRVHRRSRR